MNFATDRDLLALAPAAFTDAPLIGQTRVDVQDGLFDGSMLTSVEADFADAGVEPGFVVLIGSTPLEVIERVDEGTLAVSLPRVRTADDPIPAPHLAGADLHARARTFAPQTALVHDTLLRLLGIDPDAEPTPDTPAPLTEDNVLSLSAMARLEALGTLDLVYAAAANVTDEDATRAMLRRKAEHYRARFNHARRAASILIDTNHDGHGEERRHLGTLRLTRV